MQRCIFYACLLLLVSMNSVLAAHPIATDDLNHLSSVQREIEDLTAQQSMAAYAYVMIWVAGAGIIISAVGTVGLFISLRHTRAALNLATTANHISEKSMFLDLRPWLVIKEITDPVISVHVLDSSELILWFSGTLHLVNLGKTPAVSVSISPLLRTEIETMEDDAQTGLRCVAPGEAVQQKITFSRKWPPSDPVDLPSDPIMVDVSVKYKNPAHEDDLITRLASTFSSFQELEITAANLRFADNQTVHLESTKLSTFV